MGSQRVGHDWAEWLNRTELIRRVIFSSWTGLEAAVSLLYVLYIVLWSICNCISLSSERGRPIPNQGRSNILLCVRGHNHFLELCNQALRTGWLHTTDTCCLSWHLGHCCGTVRTFIVPQFRKPGVQDQDVGEVDSVSRLRGRIWCSLTLWCSLLYGYHYPLCLLH